jgi:hypothetical protein
MSNETGVDGGAPSFNSTFAYPFLKVAVQFQDPEGERSTTTFLVGDQGGTESIGSWSVNTLQAIANVIGSNFQLVTNCQVLGVSVAVVVVGPQLRPMEPTSGLDDIEDKALLIYQTNIGTPIKFQIPAPVAMFLSDGETVDPSESLVSEFSTAVIDAAAFVVQPADAGGDAKWAICDKAGNYAAFYDSGQLRRAKTRRKLRAGIATEIGG